MGRDVRRGLAKRLLGLSPNMPAETRPAADARPRAKEAQPCGFQDHPGRSLFDMADDDGPARHIGQAIRRNGRMRASREAGKAPPAAAIKSGTHGPQRRPRPRTPPARKKRTLTCVIAIMAFTSPGPERPRHEWPADNQAN